MRAGCSSTGEVPRRQFPMQPLVALHRAAVAGLAVCLAVAATARPAAARATAGDRHDAAGQPPPAPPRAAAAVAPQPPAIDPIERALLAGRFDEVDRAALDENATDEQKVFKARADIVRGRYDAALAALTILAAGAPAGDASIERAFLLDRLGRREEAVAQWQALVGAQEPERGVARLVRLARAFGALGQARRASSLLQEAAALAPADPRVHTTWGELFLDKHNEKDAAELFAAAIKADDSWVPAYLGLARAQAGEDPMAARAQLDKALALNPASGEARRIRAELALDERRLDDARTEIGEALAVNAVDLEALALQGALAFLEGRGDDLDRLAAQALAINPRFGGFHLTVGAQAAAHYRFEEAVALLKKAAAIDPASPRIQAALGMHLLRTGEEPAARQALERAFKDDAYDVVTYNLLALLDTLDRFETFTEGDLVLKLHPDEAPVMRESVLRLSREAIASLSKRYGFVPAGPILVEMFPKHDDFAVRTLGLPGMVGALGACFGKVVTLDSPRARAPGSFHWGATLWHELAHVMTLQASAQRVPRWVTEGASVFEERRADASWGREGEHDFLLAYAKGELVPLPELNAAFSSRRTINLAYHQSSLVVEHIVERYSDAGLHRLLKAYGTGQSQEAALKTALDATFDQLQASFDEFLARRFGEARTALLPLEEPFPEGTQADPVAAVVEYADRHARSFEAQMRAASWLVERERPDAAQRLLERAAGLVPQTMGDESPRLLLAELVARHGDRARAMRELELVLGEGLTAMEAARRLAGLARKAEDQDRLLKAVSRIVTLDPFDASAHADLGRLALAQQDVPRAVSELELAIKLGAADPAAAHTDLAEAYLAAGQPDAVRRHAIAALEVAPRYERAQELLLRVVDGR